MEAVASTSATPIEALDGPAVIGPSSFGKGKGRVTPSLSVGNEPNDATLLSAAQRMPSADFPHQFRRLSKHLTALQSRSGPPVLLFDHPPPPKSPEEAPLTSFPALHDPYDLRPFPGTIPLRPDLLSTNVERLIVSAAPIHAGLAREVKRLATWKEPNRTAKWLLVYSVAWTFKFLLPLGLALVIWLCVEPKKAVAILFPQPKSKGKRKNRKDSDAPKLDEASGVASEDAEMMFDTPDSPPTPGSWTEETELEQGAEALADQLATYVASSVPGLSANASTAAPGAAAAPATATAATAPEAAVPPALETIVNRFKPPTEARPSLAATYAPQVVKYGTSVQNVAGKIADAHERWRNIFFERSCPPPGSIEAAERFRPNVRFALPIVSILLASLLLSTEAFSRLVTFVVGLLFFFLAPATKVFASVKRATEEDRTILRGAPTDRAWVMAVAREVSRKEGIDAAIALLQLPADATSKAEVATEADLNGNAEGTSTAVEIVEPPRIRKRDRLSLIARRAMEVSEASHSLLTGQRSISFADVAAAVLPAPSGAQASASYSSSATRDRLLGLVAPGKPAGKEHEGAASFFCYQGNTPGHLLIYPPSSVTITTDNETSTSTKPSRIAFHTGIQLSFKPRQETFSLPLTDLIGIRKTSVLGFAGVWGGLEGLEVVSKDGERWTLSNVMNRDEAFLRIAILKSWRQGEEAGWVTV